MNRRRFISLEGSEGCGKTTQISLLKEQLEARGQKVIVTREPGGTALGESIRHLLKHAEEGRGMAPETELLLFAASRAELVRKVILPALEEGKWVLSDRFSDSTIVYQGIARGLPADSIGHVNGVAVGGVQPGLTILLDLPPAEAAARVRARALFDRIEEEDAAFFRRVREGFLQLSALHPERIKVVEAVPPPGKVAEHIWTRVADAFHL